LWAVEADRDWPRAAVLPQLEPTFSDDALLSRNHPPASMHRSLPL